MYGLLVNGILQTLQSKFGDKVLGQIKEKAGLKAGAKFACHKPYSETIISRLTRAAQEVTGMKKEAILKLCGENFVQYVNQQGYSIFMSIMGRHMRDFLYGLDNLHEYLRYQYPKMKAPTFLCENETQNGLKLHYRSKRKSFSNYIIGQICQVGHSLYNTEVIVNIISERETLGITHVVMQLNFDNHAILELSQGLLSDLPLSSEIFFEMFPFHIVFNQSMVITKTGKGLAAIMPHLKEEALDENFSLLRPMVDLTFENVLTYGQNVFEMISENNLSRNNNNDPCNDSYINGNIYSLESFVGKGIVKLKKLHLKGQMVHIDDCNSITFLGTPVMQNLEDMYQAGMYINDLSMHDSSRDYVLAGTQQSAALKLALDQEQEKSVQLKESMKLLDKELKRSDSLLYQMIPKTVADRIKKGDSSMDLCQVFDQVTILFSDVVGFTRICSQIPPMAVVSMLNAMYTKFDLLSEKHRVYKVETIGDAYMVVSGAPTVTKFHANHVCDMALGMLASMADLIDPATGKSMKIRIGIHSGAVVAGIVGIKMPRYCLFGDTVNIASRMESNGEAMRIHISSTTKTHIEKCQYIVVQRDQAVETKDAGAMTTYWLDRKAD